MINGITSLVHSELCFKMYPCFISSSLFGANEALRATYLFFISHFFCFWQEIYFFPIILIENGLILCGFFPILSWFSAAVIVLLPLICGFTGAFLLLIHSGESMYDSPRLIVVIWHLQCNQSTKSNTELPPYLDCSRPVWRLK